MNVISSVKNYVTNVFDVQRTAVSGAIDMVAVQHEDGSLRCTPFHVHFGHIELKNHADKQVTITVNGRVVDGVCMKLGAAGEAFFVDRVEEPVEDDYRTSPLVSPSASPRRQLSPISQQTEPTFTECPEIEPRNPPEWRDAYRLLADTTPALHRDGNESSERLAWGWGALPIVRSTSTAELSALGEVFSPVKKDDTMGTMPKCDSVYFDAMESESPSVISDAFVSDHPCMSLCGNRLDRATSQDEAHIIFSEHIVTSEQFKENQAKILQNPNLRFLIDGNIYPYNSDIQAYLVSKILFPSCPPTQLTGAWVMGSRRYSQVSATTESSDSMIWFGDDDEDNDVEFDSAGVSSTQNRRWYHWFPRSSSSDLAIETPAFQPVNPSKEPLRIDVNASVPHFRKSLIPSQSDLKQMDLLYGANTIEFTVSSASEAECVRATLYVWPVSAKVILADIDGAVSRIPRGRRLSSLIPLVDWDPHGPYQGAFEFFSKAAQNGYHIMYLTCRGLAQADFIHEMLDASDDDKFSLPSGPLLLSPDRLLETTEEELSHTSEFKLAALNGIQNLFPLDVNPFYAAFGRTLSDSALFTQAGVFPGKVFLMNEGDGRLRHGSMVNFKESYASLAGLVDKMFPPLCSASTHGSVQSNRWSIGDQYPSSTSSSPATHYYPPSPSENATVGVISSRIRTRSMGDEAFNDVNYWRIEPGSIRA